MLISKSRGILINCVIQSMLECTDEWSLSEGQLNDSVRHSSGMFIWLTDDYNQLMFGDTLLIKSIINCKEPWSIALNSAVEDLIETLNNTELVRSMELASELISMRSV